MESDKQPSALVTGVSRGIGWTLAEHLLAEGWSVVGLSRSPPSTSTGDSLDFRSVDLANSNSVEQALQDLIPLRNHISLVINAAGAGSFGRWEEPSRDVDRELAQLLFQTPVEICRWAYRERDTTQPLKVVNITSLAARFPIPFMSGYNACKAALSQFTQSIALEDSPGLVAIDWQLGDICTSFNGQMIRSSAKDSAAKRAWSRIEETLHHAPLPQALLPDFRRILRSGSSRTMVSGSFLQARLAPLVARIFPRSIMLRLIRRYYQIPGKD